MHHYRNLKDLHAGFGIDAPLGNRLGTAIRLKSGKYSSARLSGLLFFSIVVSELLKRVFYSYSMSLYPRKLVAHS